MNNKTFLSDCPQPRQITGYKDLAQNDIFEGDILKHLDGSFYLVKIDGSSGSWYVIGDGVEVDGYEYLEAVCHHLEIVGNIYANPSLLKLIAFEDDDPAIAQTMVAKPTKERNCTDGDGVVAYSLIYCLPFILVAFIVFFIITAEYKAAAASVFILVVLAVCVFYEKISKIARCLDLITSSKKNTDVR